MKYFLIISLFGITACGTSKEAQDNKRMNCPPAILKADADQLKVENINNFVSVESVKYSAGYIKLVTSYSGGCEDHEFYLVNTKIDDDGDEGNSFNFEVLHDTKGDACREFITDTLCFDVSGFKMKKGDKFWVKGFYGEHLVD